MKLIKADYIMLAAILLFLVAHITTNFLIKYYEDAAEAVGVAKSVALQYERNPIARWVFGLNDFKILFSFAIVPGMLTGLYWLIRHKHRGDVIAIEAYAISFLMIAIINVLNDVSIAVGVLL